MQTGGHHRDPKWMGGRSGYALYVFEEFALSKWVLPMEAILFSRRDWIWRDDEVIRYGACCRVYISELQMKNQLFVN